MKENLIRSGQDFGKVSQKSAEPFKPVETREEIAKIPGVSHDTIDKVKITNHGISVLKYTPKLGGALNDRV